MAIIQIQLLLVASSCILGEVGGIPLKSLKTLTSSSSILSYSSQNVNTIQVTLSSSHV